MWAENYDIIDIIIYSFYGRFSNLPASWYYIINFYLQINDYFTSCKSH